MYCIVNNCGEIEVHTEDCDLCSSCKNVLGCPLIQALTKEYVFLHYADVEVKECCLFKK